MKAALTRVTACLALQAELAIAASGLITISMQRVSPVRRTSVGAGRAGGHRALEQRAVRRTGPGSAVNIPLIDYINRTDCQWFSTISVGTPPQNFTVLWDTGSNDLLLPRSNCTTCGDFHKFDPSQSSTFSPEPGVAIELGFGTAGDSVPLAEPEIVSGTIVADTVSAADLAAPNQIFLLCDVHGPALTYQPIDGIIGLGPFNYSGLGDYAMINVLPFYWNLYDAGKLASPLFSWYIRPGHETSAELTLGGVDSTKFRGEIEWIDLDKGLSYDISRWVMSHSAVYVNGVDLGYDVGHAFPDLAILDTGTAFMMAPNNATTAALYAAISPEIRPITETGAWGAPCEVLNQVAADVTFTWGPPGGKTGNFTLPKKYFNLGPYPGLDNICQAPFNSPVMSGENVYPPTEQEVWIVGSPLLKAYYTLWDGVDLKLGWAKPKCA